MLRDPFYPRQNGKVIDGCGLSLCRLLHPGTYNMKILRPQKWKKGCSLFTAIHCGIANWWLDERKYTQDYVDKLNENYINRHPIDAVGYINKECWEKLRIVKIWIREARLLIKSWKAIAVFLYYTKEWWFELADDMIQTWRQKQTIDSKKPHYFCLKGEKSGKVFVYDSNFPKPYEIETWERFVQEGVIGKTFYVIG